MTEIRTARLLLRPARRGDLADLHAVFSDARAMQYWSTLPHEEEAETLAFIEAMMGQSPENGEDFVVEREGRVIGKAGFWRWPEVGYILHPDHWRQGIATEALRGLIDHAFRVRARTHIKADIDPRNEASIRLLTRLGFRETGREARTIKIGDEWCDSVYYQLDAPE